MRPRHHGRACRMIGYGSEREYRCAAGQAAVGGVGLTAAVVALWALVQYCLFWGAL